MAARKYSKKAGSKVKRAMHKRKEGSLRSGSGKKVKSKKQAVAIGLSEARKEGKKVPKKKSGGRAKAKSKSNSKSKKRSSGGGGGARKKKRSAKKKSSSR